MIVELKDLKIGDEIIFPKFSQLMYMKVTRLPNLKAAYPTISGMMNIQRISKGSHWRTKKETYIEIYECTPEDCNVRKTINIGGRNMWLVRRKDDEGPY